MTTLYVDANDVTHDGTVVTNDDNVDANFMTYDETVITTDETIAINETHITPQAPPLNRGTKVHIELFTASEEDAQATQTSPMFTQIEQHPKASYTFQFALSNVTYEIMDTSTLVGQPTKYYTYS